MERRSIPIARLVPDLPLDSPRSFPQGSIVERERQLPDVNLRRGRRMRVEHFKMQELRLSRFGKFKGKRGGIV